MTLVREGVESIAASGWNWKAPLSIDSTRARARFDLAFGFGVRARPARRRLSWQLRRGLVRVGRCRLSPSLTLPVGSRPDTVAPASSAAAHATQPSERDHWLMWNALDVEAAQGPPRSVRRLCPFNLGPDGLP
jgi:hypothetical protein